MNKDPFPFIGVVGEPAEKGPGVADTIGKMTGLIGWQQLEQTMVAYEFYLHEDIEESHFLGVLPERRKSSLRITRESIIRWGMLILGESVSASHLYFIQIEL